MYVIIPRNVSTLECSNLTLRQEFRHSGVLLVNYSEEFYSVLDDDDLFYTCEYIIDDYSHFSKFYNTPVLSYLYALGENYI